MINPHRIKYRGIESTELNIIDLIMCVAFDSDDGETSTYLNREAVVSETYDGRYKRVHGYKYNESFSPKFTFTKSNFGDFTMDEIRQVLRWLTGVSTASLLDVYYDDSSVVAWSAIGGWTEVNTYKLANNRTVAITATFEAVTPYALSDLRTITKDVSNPANNTITINIETDEPQSAVYPRITIQQNSAASVIDVDHVMTDLDNWVEGSVFRYNSNFYWRDSENVKHISAENTSKIETTSVSVRNKHIGDYGDITTFDALVKKNIKGETIVLDGANRIVSSSRNGRIFGDDFDWQWLPLYEGKNELIFVGNCTVTIEYRTPIKCGEF